MTRAVGRRQRGRCEGLIADAVPVADVRVRRGRRLRLRSGSGGRSADRDRDGSKQGHSDETESHL